MPAAPLPHDEERRLTALAEYDVLDTAPEQQFDEITFLASTVCEAPIALISFVDRERQWFKSRVGLEAESTPRDHAFCGHAILEPSDTLIVEDATGDDRFADNPLVQGDPEIRFYAGAPLVTPDGMALGTLCVIDHEPRTLTDDQRRALEALSNQVVAQLELRRHVADLHQQVRASEHYQATLEQKHRHLEATVVKTEERSLTDELTGVANRRALEMRLAEVCNGDPREPVSIAMIDLDGFKAVNDAQGHLVGDEVLAHVAAVLRVEARDTDTVGRYGGDEFLVIFPSTPAGGARAVAERMRRAVDQTDGPAARVTLSVGVATVMGGSEPRELLDAADQALYRAKAAGRNQIAAAIDIARDGAATPAAS